MLGLFGLGCGRIGLIQFELVWGTLNCVVRLGWVSLISVRLGWVSLRSVRLGWVWVGLG